MSLATLKKKTAHKYKNNSVSQSQFSLNGTTRNQGYIGQTSLSRTIIKTPMKGVSVRGHGWDVVVLIMKTRFVHLELRV